MGRRETSCWRSAWTRVAAYGRAAPIPAPLWRAERLLDTSDIGIGAIVKARGYAALSFDKPLAPFEFERRAPGERDVHIARLLRICHSDIHFARNE